jgi:type IV secretion system protein TrbF
MSLWGGAGSARAPKPPRTELETPATEGKQYHEMLYEAQKRSVYAWKLLCCVLCAYAVWDRIERWPLLAAKQYAPVVIAEHEDGSMRFVGEPDANWTPKDINILDELEWAVQTIRGRTKDAQFDRHLWHRLFRRCTVNGQRKLEHEFAALEKVPEKGRISIQILSINKMSEQTFDVRWEELREDLSGGVHPARFRGLFTVMIEVPRTLDGLKANERGTWLEDWSIAQDKT